MNSKLKLIVSNIIAIKNQLKKIDNEYLIKRSTDIDIGFK